MRWFKNLFSHKYKKGKLRICHIASMARNGETLILRTLAAHSRMHVVHNLLSIDSAQEDRLFNYLKSYSGKTIDISDQRVSHIKARDEDVLILKQGVWEHRHPFLGFILVRNPASVFASLKTYDDTDDWSPNTERFLRWFEDIDPSLTNGFEAKTPLQQFCLFFNRRMGALARLNYPIIHYESMVRQPEKTFNIITQWLGLPIESAMLNAHERYTRNDVGHGYMQLAKEINDSSIYKYKNILSREEFDYIKIHTADTCAAYGYDMTWKEIRINEEYKGFEKTEKIA